MFRGRDDLVGMRFGRLTVVGVVPGSTNVRLKWRCHCDCGEERLNSGHDLKAGRLQSCGCTRYETIGAKKRTHGHTVNTAPTRTFRIWTNMKTRCHNPKASNYAWYGARGISVCEAWRNSFQTFLADMGEAPDGLTLDREDSNGNYEKSNCRWATSLEQANNTRQIRAVTFDGRTQSLSAWGREVGLSVGTIHSRLKAGWSERDAVFAPKANRGQKHPTTTEEQA